MFNNKLLLESEPEYFSGEDSDSSDSTVLTSSLKRIMADTAPPPALHVKPPDSLDFQKPEKWTPWITRFERFVLVAGLSQRSDKEKVDLLCYSMGELAEEILARIIPNSEQRVVYETVKTKFTEYFAPKKNVIYERYKFNVRVQQSGENVNTFITALYTLGEKCEYGDLKDGLIRDRIVIGIVDRKVSDRLQLMSELTVDQAVTIARQAETQAIESQAIHNKGDSSSTSINRVDSGNF